MRRKLLYLFLLLGISNTILAQEDTVVIDEEIKEPPAEIDSDEYTEGDNGTRRYVDFLDKASLPDSFHNRSIPKERVQKLRDDEDFWYANTEISQPGDPKEEIKTSVPFYKRSWFQDLLLILIIVAFAGFVVWYLAGSNVGLFRRRRKQVADSLEEEELSTEDLFAINYQKEIDKAIGQGNHRLATRLLFLRLLKNLSERNIIDYRQGKTNLDYLLQLQPTRYYPDFFRITRNYEYSWYGHFEVTPEKFSLIKKDFDQFENRFYH